MQIKKSPKVNFIKQLKLICIQEGLKQKDIAKICGVSTAAVSKWFKGADLKVEYAAALARHVGITIEELAGLSIYYERQAKESTLRIKKAASESEHYSTEREKQLAFEFELTKKHLEITTEKLRRTEGQLVQVRSILSKLIKELNDV